MAATAFLFPVGCSDTLTTPPPPNDSGVQAQYVVGEALQALDNSGRFRAVRTSGHWKRPELTEDEAKRLADVYVARYAPTLPSWFERAHGASIDFGKLQQCGRIFYAETPYEEPDASVPQWIVNVAAARWFVSYCKPGQIPAVSIAVSASATHLKLRDNSFDVQTKAGSEFHAEGIPIGTTAPILPERAVEKLASESRLRVATAPRLILVGASYFPQSARWVLGLENEVPSLRESTFYVGRALQEWRQETSRGVKAQPGDSAESIPTETGTVILHRRADVPRYLTSVSFGGSGHD